MESTNGDECARESKLGSLIEKSRATLLLHRFFQEGKVATQSSLQPCNDNEYIGEILIVVVPFSDPHSSTLLTHVSSRSRGRCGVVLCSESQSVRLGRCM